jgi:hypothetical protein
VLDAEGSMSPGRVASSFAGAGVELTCVSSPSRSMRESGVVAGVPRGNRRCAFVADIAGSWPVVERASGATIGCSGARGETEGSIVNVDTGPVGGGGSGAGVRAGIITIGFAGVGDFTRGMTRTGGASSIAAAASRSRGSVVGQMSLFITSRFGSATIAIGEVARFFMARG